MRTTMLILGTQFLKSYMGGVGGEVIMPGIIFVILLIICILTDVSELFNKMVRGK